MEKLTKAEEPVMQLIWKNKKIFVKEIIEKLPDPKPPYNTVSSIVRILESKGMVGHREYGRIYQYYPKVSKKEYRLAMFRYLVQDYFDGSYVTLVSQITEQEDLSPGEIDEIKKLIRNK